jgi:Lon protease-like protein
LPSTICSIDPSLRLSSVIRLPLFPLPVVLFPGAPMPLHVFEPRYRRMVASCLEGDRRFGLIYHDPDRHGPFRTEGGGVGTIAEIEKFQPLPDGRSLIACRGRERFRIDDGVESGAPYFEAVVEPYEDAAAHEDARRVGERRRRTVALFHRVLDEAIGQEPPLPQVSIDQDPSFVLARAIKIDPAWQQQLLETRSERDRLELIDGLLSSVLDAHARGEWHPEPDEE